MKNNDKQEIEEILQRAFNYGLEVGKLNKDYLKRINE